MTKEEKIRAEYLKLGLDIEKAENKEEIANSGLCSLTDIMIMLGSCGNLSKFLKEYFNRVELGYIPKSLQGIHDNNGWIKIESEEDLPKENGGCFIYKDGIIDTDIFFCGNFINNIGVTHYQPIVKPKPPLY